MAIAKFNLLLSNCPMVLLLYWRATSRLEATLEQ